MLSNLSSVRLRQLRFEDALALNEEAFSLAVATYGENHTETALVLRARGQILARLNRFAAAEAALMRAQKIFLDVDGSDSALALKLELNIADLSIRQGQGERALLQLQSVLPRLRKNNPETHRDVLEARLWQARALLLTKDYARAEQLLRAIEVDIVTAGTVASYILPIARTAHGDAWHGLNQLKEARTAYRDALTLRAAETPVNAKAVAELEQKLGSLRD